MIACSQLPIGRNRRRSRHHYGDQPLRSLNIKRPFNSGFKHLPAKVATLGASVSSTVWPYLIVGECDSCTARCRSRRSSQWRLQPALSMVQGGFSTVAQSWRMRSNTPRIRQAYKGILAVRPPAIQRGLVTSVRTGQPCSAFHMLAAVGGAALIASILVVFATSDAGRAVAGSGMGAVNTYVQPTADPMTVGATVTAGPATTQLATSMASPTAKATPLLAECNTTGQCP